MTWVGDYSWARPSPLTLAAGGCVGVIRYLGPGNGGRDVTTAEMAVLHAAGLGLGLVWETTTTAALAGFQAGWADVDKANRYADALGYPGHLPIFYAVDTDVTPAQVRGPVADTFRGAIKASKRPVRPYGEADVLDILCGELGLMPCGWQCAAWSRGRMSSYRCMYQTWPPVMNQTVDRNELGPMPTDFLWHPDIPFDAPLEHGDEVDMVTPAEIIDPIVEHLAALAFDLAGKTEAARVSIEQAQINIQDNLAALIREQAGSTREALVAGLAAAKDQGALPAETDIDAVASAVVSHLAAQTTITTKP
jgi:hypothetical protein